MREAGLEPPRDRLVLDGVAVVAGVALGEDAHGGLPAIPANKIYHPVKCEAGGAEMGTQALCYAKLSSTFEEPSGLRLVRSIVLSSIVSICSFFFRLELKQQQRPITT